MRPSVQFTRSIAANVAYWQAKARLPHEQKVRTLDGDRHNLFRAAEFGLDLTETGVAALELILECFELIQYRGYGQDWIPILEKGLEKCPENRVDLLIRLHNQLGSLYRLERQFDMALTMHH